MIAETTYSKIHLYAEIFIAALLLVVIALLTYEVFKPPLVSKETIEELKSSAQSIENYTKELQVTASLTRQQVTEDNVSSQYDKADRDSSYNDLLSRYGIIENEGDNETSQVPIIVGSPSTGG